MKPFCAICTKLIVGAIRREPLGKNDALVAVCESCATEVLDSNKLRGSIGDVRRSFSLRRISRVRGDRK